MVGLGLGEGVVQGDVDVGADRLVRVELDDADPAAVGGEHVRKPDQDHVVVVDQGRSHRGREGAAMAAR